MPTPSHLDRLLKLLSGAEDKSLANELSMPGSQMQLLSTQLQDAARSMCTRPIESTLCRSVRPINAARNVGADRPDPKRLFELFSTLGMPIRSVSWALDLATELIAGQEYAAAESLLQDLSIDGLDEVERGNVTELLRNAQLGRRLFGFNKKVRRSVVQRSKRKLRTIVGVLLEKFAATSAWLLLHHGDELVAVVEQNTGTKDLRMSIDQGIVGQAASSKTAYVAANLRDRKDPHYFTLVEATQSELAVPVLHGKTGELLAVLNLEADYNYAFTEADKWELQQLVQELVPHILILREVDAHPQTVAGCQFNNRDWDISEVLSDFCFHVCESMEHFGPRPTCTIWQVDEEKKEMWAKATDGYDFEYLTTRTMLACSRQSFIASVAELPDGQVVRKHWSDLDVYLRRDKAQRMGLSKVIATPIHRPSSKTCFGVLNIYFFFEEQDVSDVLIQHIAKYLGAIIECHERLQTDVARAHFEYELAKARSLSTESTFSLILRMLLKALNADVGSIFARRAKSTQLKCVATTGLEFCGELIADPREAVYDLAIDTSGFTPYLATNPGTCIRKNDVPRLDEPVRMGEGQAGREQNLAPLNKYRETFALSETDHRRFLGLSLPAPDEASAIAVIRLVRSPSSIPFAKSDETVLRTLTEAFQHIFLQWQREAEFESYVRDVRERLFPGPQLQVESARAFQCLIRPTSAGLGASHVIVDELLQQVLAFFKSYGSLHASVREVAHSPDGEECFRLFHYHSTRSRELPDETMYPPITRKESSIGWKSIEKWRILTFITNRCRPLFKPLHKDSHLADSGIVVPLVTWTGGRCVKWVLSVDFSRRVEWTPMLVEFALHIARKLSAILSDAAPPVFLPPATFLKGFVASGVEAVRAEWALLDLFKRGQKGPAFVAKYSKSGLHGSTWERGPGETGAFGVEITPDGRALRIPLLFGPLEAGHLTCGSKTMNYGQENVEIGKIIRLWSSLTGFPGDDISMWVSEFHSTPDKDYPDGIQVWKARPELNPDTALSVAFKTPLIVTSADAACLQSL